VIASVRGEVLLRRADHVVIDTGGVGYRLNVSAETLKAVPPVGKDTFLHSHLVVREDVMQLLGFATEEERDLFLYLNSVSGVGPKVAMAILSGGSPRELMKAIALGDAKRFQAVQGVGKRTAERVIVELREKVAGELESAPAASPVAGSDEPRMLARDGLVGLGYTLMEAERLLDGAEGEAPEELISIALKRAGDATGSRNS
jgi:Holliday junction DNA helicase RuvA